MRKSCYIFVTRSCNNFVTPKLTVTISLQGVVTISLQAEVVVTISLQMSSTVTISLQGSVTISLQRVDVVTISLQSSRRPVTISLQPVGCHNFVTDVSLSQVRYGVVDSLLHFLLQPVDTLLQFRYSPW